MTPLDLPTLPIVSLASTSAPVAASAVQRDQLIRPAGVIWRFTGPRQLSDEAEDAACN